MGKLKVEDLKNIREAMKGTVNLREGDHRVKITVHMGTCGIAAGARKIMDVLLAELAQSYGVVHIVVHGSEFVEAEDPASATYPPLDVEGRPRTVQDDHRGNQK